jgi:hypothetical protein
LLLAKVKTNSAGCASPVLADSVEKGVGCDAEISVIQSV